MMGQAWIDTSDAMAVVQQCALAGVSRVTFYAQQRPGPIDESDLMLRCLIDEEYARRAIDNIFVKRLWRSVKHEDVYLKGYASMSDLMIGLA